MKKDAPKNQATQATPAREDGATATDDRVAQRHQKQGRAAQLSNANVEESSQMDRGDSAEGTGQSLTHGTDAGGAAESLRRGALDAQYGTKSWMKTGGSSAPRAGSDAGREASKGADRDQAAPNPASSEDSSGAERDTMTASRPGSRS